MKKNIIIDAGPTNERIDAVMKITNMSTGALGSIIADTVLTNFGDEIENLVNEIEAQVYNKSNKEITTLEIGEMVMDGLKKLDDVAYVRFASVYRQFKDSNTFLEELKKMLEKK